MALRENDFHVLQTGLREALGDKLGRTLDVSDVLGCVLMLGCAGIFQLLKERSLFESTKDWVESGTIHYRYRAERSVCLRAGRAFFATQRDGRPAPPPRPPMPK